MVLAVIKERLAPRMDTFYDFSHEEGKDSIEVLIDAIKKVATKEELVRYGCPLNRLNQEMSPIDKEFEEAITPIYNHIKSKIVTLIEEEIGVQVEANMLAEFVIATVWGALSLSPSQSSKERYLTTVTPLIHYLKTLKK